MISGCLETATHQAFDYVLDSLTHLIALCWGARPTRGFLFPAVYDSTKRDQTQAQFSQTPQKAPRRLHRRQKGNRKPTDARTLPEGPRRPQKAFSLRLTSLSSTHAKAAHRGKIGSRRRRFVFYYVSSYFNLLFSMFSISFIT